MAVMLRLMYCMQGAGMGEMRERGFLHSGMAADRGGTEVGRQPPATPQTLEMLPDQLGLKAATNAFAVLDQQTAICMALAGPPA